MIPRKLLFQILAEEFQALHGNLPEGSSYAKDLNYEIQQKVDETELTRAEVETIENRKNLKILTDAIHKLGGGESANFAAVAPDGTHHRQLPRSALCLSGGGIRSATFGLGVLQSLAGHKLLDKFDYLSTVSGGGFIGSWLTAWIHREGPAAVIDKLVPRQNISGDDGCGLGREAKPVKHLRDYSSYLSPRLGIFSADTWTLVAIYLRNLLLNWLVMIPLLAAALIIPRIYLALAIWMPDLSRKPSLLVPLVALAIGSVGLCIGIFYVLLRTPSTDTDPANAVNDQAHFLRWCLVPTLVAAFAFTLTCHWFEPLDPDAFPNHAILTWYLRLPGWARFAAEGAAVFFATLLAFAVWEQTAETSKDRRGERLGRRLNRALAAAVSGGVAGLMLAACFGARALQNPLLFASLAFPLFGGAFLLAGALYMGLTSRLMQDVDREWWARMGAWVLIASLGWLVLAPVVLLGPEGFALLPRTVAALGGGSALFTVLAGGSAKTPANSEAGTRTTTSGFVLHYALILIAPIFILFLCAGLSWLTSQAVFAAFSTSGAAPPISGASHDLLDRIRRALDALRWPSPLRIPEHFPRFHHQPHLVVLVATRWWAWLLLAVALASLSLVSTRWISINKFSLSGSYRDRIIRAYLGASRKDRKPNPFTGFDVGDNIPLDQLWPNVRGNPHAPGATDPPPRGGGRPFHVLNMALNLVSGKDLAWQQRKAESFTASPLYCGSPLLGYRSSKGYFGPRAPSVTDYAIADGATNPISLGTAVAISGAAASPNMGYHSSPALGFIMTLFNVRSGWWAGNPGPAGDKTCTDPQPRAAALLLAQEALGLTDDAAKYVYLSDGGHFDNLGLYEMVLRRCRYIVVSDAGQDSSYGFEDLANAVRKINIDFGIRITFEAKIQIFPRKPAKAGGRYCALGTIHYADSDGAETPPGHLIYVKPALYEDEPIDIYNYAKGSEEFPHEPTVNQFFTESQFESYRHLGQYVMDTLLGKKSPTQEPRTFENWQQVVEQVNDYLAPNA